VESALKLLNWTHALLLDDDVVLPEDGLRELIKLNTDIAIMDYPMHGKLEGKAVGTIVHDADKSVAFAGLGAVLVKREVFEKINTPWFILTQYRINRSNDGRVGFYASQPDTGQTTLSAGEDTYFYLQAKKHGFKIKETKKTATHCRIDQLITNTHTIRYSRQHAITKADKIERELL
jgi:hypothetical protein